MLMGGWATAIVTSDTLPWPAEGTAPIKEVAPLVCKEQQRARQTGQAGLWRVKGCGYLLPGHWRPRRCGAPTHVGRLDDASDCGRASQGAR